MNIKQTILIVTLVVGTALVGSLLQPSAVAVAAKDDDAKCETAVLPDSLCETGSGKVEESGIWGLLLLVINILTAGIGLVAVGGLVYAAILYTTAQDNSSQITKAKEMMFNVVLGIVAFAGMWAFLQFLIPGGIFSS